MARKSDRFLKTSNKSEETIRRKSEHLRIVADEDVSHSGTTLLEDVQLVHQALPELNLDEIDTSTDFFGKDLSAPLMITSMTGGSEFSEEMNRGLAQAAEETGVAFAVGSQRVMLRHPETTAHFAVREFIPNGVLLGNIGAVQLEEYAADTIADLVDSIDADGMCVHLNAAQELVQNEGHRRFSGILDRIARLLERLDGRLLVKETGAGISPETASKLHSIGVPYIDVSGSGGTSWTKVEMFRANKGLLRQMGAAFADWGVPTAFSVMATRRICGPDVKVISSGGITCGLDVARSLAIGADIGGIARSILMAFLEGGTEGACDFIQRITEELRLAMLLTGAKDVPSLARVSRVIKGDLRDWLLHYGWSSEG